MNNKLPSYAKILNAVAGFYQISAKDLLGRRRKKELVKPRQIVIYFLREILNKSYPRIAELVGNRDHTTAIYAYKKIKLGREEKVDLRQELEQVSNIINTEELKTLLQPQRSQKLVPSVFREDNGVQRLERVIEKLKKTPASFVITEREKSMLEEWRLGKTLEKIGKEWKLTRERVRQIITKAILREIANKINDGFEIDIQEFLRQEKNQHKNLQDKLCVKSHPEEKKDSVELKRWSRYYARCRQCGTTIIPHRSHGLCRKCCGLIINREEIIRGRNKKCEKCGISRESVFKQYGRDLYVTRLNKGRGKFSDYLVLCRGCFLKITGKRMGAARHAVKTTA